MSRNAPQHTVLVVEDTDPMRQLIAQLLAHAGYNVLEAVDGASALYIIYQHYPDLILLDIHLPDMTGLDLAALIDGFPFVILTMDPDPELFRIAQKLGALNYFIKPPNATEFTLNVALAIQHGKNRTHLQKAMHTNRNIAKAVGVLIGCLGWTEKQADQWVREYSTRHRRSLYDIAQAILHSVDQSGGSSQQIAQLICDEFGLDSMEYPDGRRHDA